jgi:hypothetical protein
MSVSLNDIQTNFNSLMHAFEKMAYFYEHVDIPEEPVHGYMPIAGWKGFTPTGKAVTLGALGLGTTLGALAGYKLRAGIPATIGLAGAGAMLGGYPAGLYASMHGRQVPIYSAEQLLRHPDSGWREDEYNFSSAMDYAKNTER